MVPPIPPTIRIYRDEPPTVESTPDPARLAAQELLRPIAVRSAHRELEPFSRAWFEELEIKRYAPHGVWLRRALEFTRHSSESLLMIGPGVGTDALQYHRHGTQVTICAQTTDHPELIHRNFELRGLDIRIVHAGPEFSLPFDRWSFDLAYLNLLYDQPENQLRLATELYRVLKPGGKLFALAPSRFDPGFWQNLLVPYRRWYKTPVKITSAPRYSARNLRRLFPQFAEHSVIKRHLRSSEMPHLWRIIPNGIMARIMGRVLVLKAFKPVTAALEAIAEEPAA